MSMGGPQCDSPLCWNVTPSWPEMAGYYINHPNIFIKDFWVTILVLSVIFAYIVYHVYIKKENDK